MIVDLKADSERWAAEQRATAARGAPVGDYRSSKTHQARQYYGPTTEATNYSDNYHVAGGDLAMNQETSDKPPIAKSLPVPGM
jgi:hypothetical protein